MDKQPRAAEAMECPGLEHPEQNKAERPKQNDGGSSLAAPEWNIRGRTSSKGRRPPNWMILGQVAARRPGRAHPRRNTEQELPPSGLYHPGASGGQRPQTGSSWRMKQQEPLHPGLDHQGTRGGRTPQTGTSGVDQAAGATGPRTRLSRDTWRADARDRNSRGRTRRSGHNPQDWIGWHKWRGAKGRNVRGGTSSTSPHPPDRSRRSTKDYDTEEQRHGAEDEAEGMQSSNEEAGPSRSREADERASPR